MFSRFWSVLLYLIVGLAIMGRVILHPNGVYVGGSGDPQQFMWYLGWFWHALGQGHNPFYTTLLNSPHGQNLMWNTSILAVSGIFGPLGYLIGFTALYNLLWLFNFVLACWMGERILLKLKVQFGLAVFGGILIGIMPFETSQMLFHIHLWFTVIILGIVWMLVCAYQDGVRHPYRFGLLLGLLAALEFYTSTEMFTLAVCTAVLLWILSLILWRRGMSILPLRSIIIAAAALIVLAIPGFYGMFVVPGRTHGAGLLLSRWFFDDFLTFFLPSSVYALHTPATVAMSHQFSGNFWENDGYLGIFAMVLLGFAARRLWRHHAARVGLIGLVVLVILSLGPHLYVAGHNSHVDMPWRIALDVPFIQRAIPSRLMLFADILVVILVVMLLDQAFQPPHLDSRLPSRRSSRICLGVLAVLMLISWLPRIPYPVTPKAYAERVLIAHPAMLADLRGEPTFFLMRDRAIAMQMLADTDYQIPMVNFYGYTNNTGSRNSTLLTLRTLSAHPNRSAVHKQLLRLPAIGAKRLVYYPIRQGQHIPAAWYRAVVDVYGSPKLSADGVLVWNLR